MREIKTKAWDGKSWREDFYLDRHGKPFLSDYCSEGEPHTPVDWDIVQFTGLLDSKGKEIYEGDIISNGRGDGWSAVVVWNENQCGFYIKWNLGYSPLSGNARKSIWEVIGNIHQHPDLLP